MSTYEVETVFYNTHGGIRTKNYDLFSDKRQATTSHVEGHEAATRDIVVNQALWRRRRPLHHLRAQPNARSLRACQPCGLRDFLDVRFTFLT